MSARKGSARAVPENINEEYYQISGEILSSFPRYRPPVDLFFFREDIAVLAPYSRKGARLSNEQVDEVARLCAEGNLFVSRSDHHIYSKHIVKQLDLVLQDNNLKEQEIANICVQALVMRYEAFYQQPVKAVFDALHRDALVVTEYVFKDSARMGAFMRRLSTDYSPARHAFNSFAVGAWLWLKKTENPVRKDLDNLAVGLLAHDIGMSKMPPYLLTRPGPLKPDERDKLVQHPILSAKILQKMDLGADAVLQACLQHHERLDGSGYPQKLKANQLSTVARIAAIADSFAAMITKRPYGDAKQPLEAANELAASPAYDNNLARTLVGAYAMNKF